MNKKRKLESVDDIPVVVPTIKPTKGTSKSVPGPKRLTNIPKRGR